MKKILLLVLLALVVGGMGIISFTQYPQQLEESDASIVSQEKNTAILQEEINTSTAEESIIEDCTIIDDFSGEDSWFIINDSIMGGRSSGGYKIEDNILIFSGSTNTDGGGFSSIRLRLNDYDMSNYSKIIIDGISDGRGYDIAFRDINRRNISHRSRLSFIDADTETAEVLFADLSPSFFGRSIPARSLDRTKVREIGIIINDGKDGDFILEIYSIRLCR